jgi:hypothetical protein
VTSGNWSLQSLDSRNAESPKFSGVSGVRNSLFFRRREQYNRSSLEITHQKSFHQTQLESDLQRPSEIWSHNVSRELSATSAPTFAARRRQGEPLWLLLRLASRMAVPDISIINRLWKVKKLHKALWKKAAEHLALF